MNNNRRVAGLTRRHLANDNTINREPSTIVLDFTPLPYHRLLYLSRTTTVTPTPTQMPLPWYPSKQDDTYYAVPAAQATSFYLVGKPSPSYQVWNCDLPETWLRTVVLRGMRS